MPSSITGQSNFLKAMQTACSGMKAQQDRLKIISQNIAGAHTTADKPGGKPYGRQVPIFKSYIDPSDKVSKVKMHKVHLDKSPFKEQFEPSHPAANEKGIVLYPNVNWLIEMQDSKQAHHGYSANLSVFRTIKDMMAKTLRLIEG